MRPCLASPLPIRNTAFGGAKPLFCVPLVAKTRDDLAEQARTSQAVSPDLVEWRADHFGSLTAEAMNDGMRLLREILGDTPLIYTLRIDKEGGAKAMPQEERAALIEAVLRSDYVDIVDVELCNGPAFLDRVIATAHAHKARVILSFHNFESTPSEAAILETIAAMQRQNADIAKVACMPREGGDVLRLLSATLTARRMFPALPLCTMSMAALGGLSRVAGFLYGSDMAFAVGQTASAPGQIPMADARALAEGLLRYA
jgi:3-dehydroquinate dehydratase-1